MTPKQIIQRKIYLKHQYIEIIKVKINTLREEIAMVGNPWMSVWAINTLREEIAKTLDEIAAMEREKC